MTGSDAPRGRSCLRFLLSRAGWLLLGGLGGSLLTAGLSAHPGALGAGPSGALAGPPLAVACSGCLFAGLAPASSELGQVSLGLPVEEAAPFFEELAAVKIAGRWGYIDKSGQLVIPPQFDYAKAFFSGLGAVLVGERWGYIDRSGRMIVPPQFESAEPHYNRVTAAKLDGRWVYIDRSGQVVIAALPAPERQP